MASRARANTPAASGAAAEVPEWVRVHFPYKSVVALTKEKSFLMHIKMYFRRRKLTTPVLGSLAPLLKVEAKVDEQDSS